MVGIAAGGKGKTVIQGEERTPQMRSISKYGVFGNSEPLGGLRFAC